MRLDVPVNALGPVEVRPLVTAVLDAPSETWLQDTLRQDEFEQHKDTESLILCFCDGWPNLKMMKGRSWDALYPFAVPVIDQILDRGYTRGGKVVRMMAAKLKPGGHIPLHSDTHPSFAIGHRIHVPLKTNEDVEFIVGGHAIKMVPDHAYEIDNLRNHEVTNRGTADRIHLIFDYIPSEALGGGVNSANGS